MRILIICSLIFSVLNQIPLIKKYNEYPAVDLKNSSIPLKFYPDYSYYTEFLIGTPAQKIEWLQDSWVGETWLNLNIANQTYQSNKSSSFNLSSKAAFYNYTYGVGMVYGYEGTEIIGLSSINLTNLTIPILFSENGTGRGKSYTGSVGLANNYNYKNWLEIAAAQKILNDSMFAYDLRDGEYFYASSSMFPIKVSEITWFNTEIKNYWGMGNFTATTINQITYPQDSTTVQAVWDSGFIITYITKNAFNGLIALPDVANYCQLNPTYQFSIIQQQFFKRIYVCPCNRTYPSVSIQTSKMNFEAFSKDYMFELQGSYCVLGIDANPADWTPFAIFGTTMFRNYFVAYDKANGRIGFSKFRIIKDQCFFFRAKQSKDFNNEKSSKFLQK